MFPVHFKSVVICEIRDYFHTLIIRLHAPSANPLDESRSYQRNVVEARRSGHGLQRVNIHVGSELQQPLMLDLVDDISAGYTVAGHGCQAVGLLQLLDDSVAYQSLLPVN